MRVGVAAPNWAHVTVGILAAGYVFCVIVNWPGHLTYDSIVQISEGRAGSYGNWHPPVMSWLLGTIDAMGGSTGVFAILDATLLYGALVLIVVRRPASPWSALLAVLLIATPQFLIYPGIVWKDVLFAHAAIAGFAAIAFSDRDDLSRHARLVAMAAAIVLFALAILARQNGLAIAPFAILALGSVAWRRAPAEHRLGALARYAGAATLLLALIAGSANLALHQRVPNGISATPQLRLLQVYDLAGALHADPQFDIANIEDDDPALAQLMRGDAARLYTPVRNDTLASSARLQAELRNVDDSTIPTAWWSLVENRTLLYLTVRRAAFDWVLFTPNLMLCSPIAVGVAGPPDLMRKLGIAPRVDRRDLKLVAYASAFVRTPVLSHIFYAGLGFAAMVWLFIRRGAGDLPLAFLLMAAFTFTASFFVISIACDYRYLLFLDDAAVVAVFYLSLDLRLPDGLFPRGLFPQMWRNRA